MLHLPKALWLALFAGLFLSSCNLFRHVESTEEPTDVEYRQLDTLSVFGEANPAESPQQEIYKLPRYNASATRTNDLLHTSLDLSFDWENETVNGTAQLKVKPYFYPTHTLELDAKGFEIQSVSLLPSGPASRAGKSLSYEYDGKKLSIQLDREYTRDQTYELEIKYTAHPKAEGGSAAINSDKGLYFINPKGEPGKPQQIWTQGETESNSRWFPTIDKPNERHTQDIRLTVQDRFVTLSNGLLVSSTPAGNGMRTDHWVMDKGIAPYLTMIAVGEWAVVKDRWNGIEVSYYVEPEYEADARSIFPYTPEMLAFYSDILGVPYPWQKYSQVVVRDFVSGAMENTTAVTFMEMVQAHSEDLVDRDMNELIVTHEMFHHWFGDLVTTESWANITLNEGFANYSEYLWMEHKHGRDAAEAHRLEEMDGYLSSRFFHPLIYFGYENREDVFDGHSYNKGGLILHMLRTQIGDDAFFTALKQYLQKNAYTDVEAHELRLAFEDVTGQDLNWFFNQWFYAAGHPELEIEKTYSPENQSLTLHISQVQTPTDEIPAIFQLPFKVDVYMADGSKQTYSFKMDRREQSFQIPASSEPALVVFDTEHSMLAVINYPKTEEEYDFQYKHAPTFFDRKEAIDQLEAMASPLLNEIWSLALNDPAWPLRVRAVENCPATDANIQRIAQLALNDPRVDVRSAALMRLGDTQDKAWMKVALESIEKDPSAAVRGAALTLIYDLDPSRALQAAEQLQNTQSSSLIKSLANIFAESGDPKYLDFFESKFDLMNNFDGIEFVSLYAELALSVNPAAIERAANQLDKGALNSSYMPWYRFGIVSALNKLHTGLVDAIKDIGPEGSEELIKLDEEIKAKINRIRKEEPDKRLKSMYKRFPS